LITLLKELDQDNPDRITLIRIVDATLRQLDIRELNYPVTLPKIREHDPTAAAFYRSVPSALDLLKRSLAALPRASAGDEGISVIGYSHIDTCWLWPFYLTRFKSANTITGMLHLIDHPPSDFENPVSWKFLATAAQHYRWLREDAPDVYDRMRTALRGGRWEANGAMWVEPDTTLPGGESLVRQLALGVRFFERELGVRQTVLVLPDCFGFSANLPQILKKSGIDSFLTAKISWCEYTHFPHSTFVWRGIDGSDVLTHFITTPSSWSYQTATYTGVSTAYELIGTLKAYKQRAVLPRSALHTSGNGDGGGGITEEMAWNLNIMAELPRVQGVPRLAFPSLTELFEGIRARKDDLPVWDDELYLEYHRGTLTTQEEVKRQNRQLEAHLHNVEWLLVVAASICGANASAYQEEIGRIWEDTLLFHFHDAIPGSSVNEANQDIVRRGRPHLERLRELEGEIASVIGGKMRTATVENAGVVFNTLSHARRVGGTLIPSGGWSVVENEIPVDRQETTTYERVVKNESFVVHTLVEPFVDAATPPSKRVLIDKTAKTATSKFIVVSFDDNGTIRSVRSVKTGREYLSGPANQFELYEDRPLNWPAWDIQLYHKEMQIESPVLQSIEFADDCVRTNFSIARVGDGPAETSTVTQLITFSPDSPTIDFKTVVNWTQHSKLLKVAFPTTVRARTARFGIQFGHIERPTHKNTECDMAKFEAAGR
jgi:alpha-mannosidase